MDYVQTPSAEVKSAKFTLPNDGSLQLFEKGSTFADLLFGSVAGMLGKLIEYPLDTVKVRLQSQPAGHIMFEGPWDCLRKTVHHEGFLGLYRGLSSPLVGAMLENSALFVGYAQGQKLIRKFLRGEDLDEAEGLPELTLSELCLAGGFSGIAATFVLTPIELIKCKLQVQEARMYRNSVLAGSHTPHFSGPISVITHTLKSEGVAGFYRGNLPTLFREVGGGAAWFGVYEAICRRLITQKQKETKTGEVITKGSLGAGQLMFAGALAGMSYNFALFPADVIKSQMQTEIEVAPSQYSRQLKRGILQIAKELYAAEGIRGFYRGCGITVAKSAPTSAIIFFTHETLTRRFT
ncbi:mitochondrial carrier [Basidiobolus meristosporus CBS 931.73]|uniref:Mitochondrial carrier n=1 Tax=Basidiobolus meristosporus CBS 931.73 TaxID=1314790 RepID=A0A1Y1XT16_9FUNG|nr:mitochondrial carrier [Basidiobolus meristosporus CBS 931.73]|eukprot:ORX88878.1 mitochondrial carrier [Basidiobolus meristosporus CBS 931.73]